MLNLSSIDGQVFQKSNAAGVQRVFAVLARNILSDWPTPALVLPSQEVVGLPTLLDGAEWVEYIFPKNTASFDCIDQGDPGYESNQHLIDFALAASSDEVHEEMSKHINAGSVYIIIDKDGNYNIVGSSEMPIFLQKTFATGKAGSDKRGYDLTGSADGIPFGVVKLHPALVSDFEGIITEAFDFSDEFSIDFFA